VVLASQTQNRQMVARCCRLAAGAGVRAGMTVAHARALLGGRMLLRPHQPQRDASALAALAQWAMRRFSPVVAVDGDDGLLMDITGCQRLFGGERELVVALARALRRLGFDVRIATAATVGCAWAVARYGAASGAYVPDGRERAAISPLPVAALRLDEKIVAALAQVGVVRVGQVLELSRASLAQRFGPVVPLRIDAALGLAWEQIQPAKPVSAPQVRLVLAGPVKDARAIELGARNLLGRLLAKLRAGDLGVRRMELELARSDLQPLALTVRLSQPSADEKHLWTLLRPEVERAHMGFGVEGLKLTAWETDRLEHQQMALPIQDLPVAADAGQLLSRANMRELGAMVDVLSGRLGESRVAVTEPVESHVPEKSFRQRPAIEALRHGKAAAAAGHARPKTAKSKPGSRREALFPPGDRPSVLLERPEPLRVVALTPDGPVMSLRWAGRNRRITACIGPERIGPQWWDARLQPAPPGDGASRQRVKPTRPGVKQDVDMAREGSGQGMDIQGRLDAPPPELHSHGSRLPGSATDGDAQTRDYYKLQDDTGLWLWVYRELQTGNWLVHGVWE
jgi:protein ImuB